MEKVFQGVEVPDFFMPSFSSALCASARKPAVRIGVCVPFAPLAPFALYGSADLDAFALFLPVSIFRFSQCCSYVRTDPF
jgi:hypothetical protein